MIRDTAFQEMSLVSHIVHIQTEVRDAVAIRSACHRLQLPEPVQGTVPMFAGQQATGWGVQLPGWRYPVVCETDTGQIRYDNFGGHWGETTRLDQFLQAYAVEKAKLEARRQGHTVTEQPLADGSIKLTIQVAGSAS